MGGGPGSLRATSSCVCACFTPFAFEQSEDVPEDCPSLGWVAAAVTAGRGSGAEAVKALVADKANASATADGVAYGHPAGLQASVQLVQQATKTVAPASNESSIFGVFVAAAEEAWDDGEEVYEVVVGKKQTLEELVDMYATELAEDGWIRMIVQPFRLADAAIGCELLHARAPNLRLVLDLDPGVFGTDGAPRGISTKGEAYSGTWPAAPSASEFLAERSARAGPWCESDGCSRYMYVDAKTAQSLSCTVEMALAWRDAEVVCMASDCDEAAVNSISERVDDLLWPLQSSPCGADAASAPVPE